MGQEQDDPVNYSNYHQSLFKGIKIKAHGGMWRILLASQYLSYFLFMG